MIVRRFFVAALGIASLSLTAQPLVEGPIVLLVGAPGAGKTTQAGALAKAYHLPVVTLEELVSSNADVFAKIRESKIKGIEPQTDPVLNRLFEDRLKTGTAKNGVIVAGYPSTKDHADFIVKMIERKALPTPVVIQLDVPDDDVRKRLAGNSSYPTEKLEQLIKDYHREFDMLKLYFPNAEIVTIDGRAKIPQVTKKIREVLDKKIPVKK